MTTRATAATLDSMADRPSRAKEPEDRVNEEYGHDRKKVAIRLREELYEAIEKHRGSKTWSVAAHEVIEAGLKSLGWKVKKP